MKNFLKIVFGSCLGVFLAGIVMMFLGFGTLGAVANMGSEKADVDKGSVLVLKFNNLIPEKTNNLPLDPLDFKSEKVVGLHDLIRAIEYAKDDSDIAGILLDMSNMPGGNTTKSSIRKAIQDFKSDGKFVVAYSENYSQGAYYMASVADKIFVHPLGGITFTGFSGTIPFFKDMIDRLGIKMQIYYAGQFKSATEPFRLKKMSAQNKLQTREYLEGMYQIFLEDISEARDIPVDKLRRIADEYTLRQAEDCVTYGFADVVGYYDEALADLRSRLSLDEDDKIPSISLAKYATGRYGKSSTAKNKVAVVYAEGSIVDGKGEAGNIGGDKYAKIIRKLRQDDNTKALVLRINSGGGSALASDIMWRELELFKQTGRPFMVSFGDVAASGGYYIACAADSIFAEPNSITGSIGVFGMIPSAEDMMREKVGITFDTIKTGKYAHGISPFIDISPEEGQLIQESVDNIYETFLKRVSEGRDMTRDEVHEVAQGRVWLGSKGKEIGLVDVMGGLNDAIAAAAEKANLEKYRTSEYPRVKEPFQQMLEQFTGAEEANFQEHFIKRELGELYPYLKELSEVKSMEGPQARMPFVIPSFD